LRRATTVLRCGTLRFGRDTFLPDLADQFGDRRPVSGQEECIDGASDDLLSLVVQHAVTFRPAAFAVHQRHYRSACAKGLEETVCCCFADAELPCEIENVADTPAIRSIPQKLTDGGCTPMRFIPCRVGNLVREGFVHEKNPAGKSWR
jgi:hypothetical protein